MSDVHGYFALSESGVLVYLPGFSGGLADTELVWMTRSGDEEAVGTEWRFASPIDDFGWKLSPDGRHVAVTRDVDGNLDIWIKDLPDGPFDRLTFDEDIQAYPIWTPDGQFVAYISGGGVLNFNLWRQNADGTGSPELMHDDRRSLLQPRWSKDGEWMVFRTSEGATGRDIVALRPGVDTAVVSLVVSEDFTEWGPALSSDGRWLAYSSNETGREEVYVRPFPDVDSGRATISIDGGSNPQWAHGASELFYFDSDRRLVAVSLQTDPEFTVVSRQSLFTLGPEYLMGDGGADYYDIAPDDQRFLVGRVVGATSDDAPPRYVVVQNFFEELKRLVPN